MDETQTIPEFPIPEFNDVQVAFGAPMESYIPYEKIPREFMTSRGNLWTEAVGKLFFNGGKLSDFGLKFKSNIDSKKAMRAIKALLVSFNPKHEVKIGTVAIALANWCEEISPKA